jgi:ABC-type nitrate/sulfonate/bicarbonate transport system substrate-binding protein
MRRRQVLGGAAGLVAASSVLGAMRDSARAAPAPATPAAAAVTVLTPFGFIIDFLEIMNAQAGGHFAANGIDATVLGAGGAAAAIQQLAAGRCQFSRGAAIDAMRAVAAQNLDLVSIATLFQGSTFVVISAADKPIRTAEDLRGKRIGVVSIGGTTENFLDLMLTKAGIGKAETPREVVGNNPGAFALIGQGRIDGFIATMNVASALRGSGARIETFSTDKYAPMPSQIYLTTRAIVDARPDLCRGFVRAIRASVEEIIKGPVAPLLDRAAKSFDIPGMRDRAALAQTVADDIPLWLSQGDGNLMRNVPALWKSARDSLVAAGLAQIGDETRLYTNVFVDQAG